MRAVIYARYSSDNQREESIEGQLRECKEYADYNEMTVVATYIDRALSARTDDRPEFQKMIKDSYKSTFDIVIVWKLDRFSRDRYDSAHYKMLLKRNKVKVVSAKETISNGPEGILLESLLEGYAEFYSAELAVKVKRGLTDNALKGKWNGGSVPFGYIVSKEQRLEIEPKSAAIVKQIYKMAYDGRTVRDIHKYLEENNISRTNGKPLRYNAVHYILSNKTYIGEYNHSGVTIEHGVPAIVEESVFNAVQRELQKNAKAPARHTAEDDYLLTTKLFCGKCGAMMVAQAGTSHTGDVYRYYACVRQKKHKCDKKMVKKDNIENFVVQKTMAVLQDNSVIEELSALLYNLQENENTLIPQLQKQLHEKEREIENIVSAIQKGVASDSLMKRLGEIEQQKQDIETSIAKESIKCPTYTRDEYRMSLANYRKIDISKQDGKRKIIDTFINAIYLYDDHLKIVYNGNNKEESVSLEALEGSTLFSSGAPEKSTLRRAFFSSIRAVREFYASTMRDIAFGSDMCFERFGANRIPLRAKREISLLYKQRGKAEGFINECHASTVGISLVLMLIHIRIFIKIQFMLLYEHPHQTAIIRALCLWAKGSDYCFILSIRASTRSHKISRPEILSGRHRYCYTDTPDN